MVRMICGINTLCREVKGKKKLANWNEKVSANFDGSAKEMFARAVASVSTGMSRLSLGNGYRQ